MLSKDKINIKETFALTEEQITILDGEKQRHQKCESKSYTWEEAKETIRANKVGSV